MKSTLFRSVLTALVLFNAILVEAHVTVVPRESAVGGMERYTVRIPTEGQVATTSVELEVPPNVTVSGILVGTGYSYETRRDGRRISAITWKQEIQPFEVAEFVFFATNPRNDKQIVWKAHQRFADGTSTDWIGPVGDRRPASLTRLTPAPR